MRDCRGFTILEILIVAGLASVIALAIATTLMNQQKETRALGEKMATLEFQRSLNLYFSSAGCTQALAGLTFDFTQPDIPVSVAQLLTGDAGSPVLAKSGDSNPISPLSTTTLVSTIQLVHFKGAGNQYTADLNINWAPPPVMVRTLNPASIKVSLITNPGPPTAQTIASCVTNTDAFPLSCISVNKAGFTDPLNFCGSPSKMTVCSSVHSSGGGWTVNNNCTPAVSFPDSPTLSISCAATEGDVGWTEPLFACAINSRVAFCTARHTSDATGWNWHPGNPSLLCVNVPLPTLLGSDTDPIRCSFIKGGPGTSDPLFFCQTSTHIVTCTGRYEAGAWSVSPDCSEALAP